MDNIIDLNYENHNPELILNEFETGITPEDITKRSHNGMAIRKENDLIAWKNDEEIYDPADIEAIEIKEGDIFLQVGSTVGLTIVTTPAIANEPELVWESSDNSIIEVNQSGVIFAKAEGSADIFASVPGSFTKCFITATATADGKVGPDKPAEKENTPEQDAIEQNIEEQILNGTTSIAIPEGANNITIPEGNTKAITLTGNIAPGATITNKSGKSVTINNGDSEPVNIIIDSPNASVTLKGNYTEVWANTKTINASGAKISSVTFDNELEGKGNLSVNADWSDPVEVISYNTNNMTISNASDESVLEELTVTAPRSTVTINGKWGNVNATVSKHTLMLGQNFHANKLVVLAGNVLVKNCFPEQAYDEIELAEGSTVGPCTYYCPGASNTTSNPGVYNIVSDCRYTNGIVFGAFASGNYEYNNYSRFETGNKNGICLVRSGVHAYFKGEGTWVNPKGYGMWLASDKGSIDIYGGHFIAETHAVYAEKGTINIYGGEFELNAGDPKYLLNCLDAAYTAGTAKIIVSGGKFHNFDPANSMSEVGGPVSFVAPGYKSVEIEEGIWEVMKDE